METQAGTTPEPEPCKWHLFVMDRYVGTVRATERELRETLTGWRVVVKGNAVDVYQR